MSLRDAERTFCQRLPPRDEPLSERCQVETRATVHYRLGGGIWDRIQAGDHHDNADLDPARAAGPRTRHARAGHRPGAGSGAVRDRRLPELLRAGGAGGVAALGRHAALLQLRPGRASLPGRARPGPVVRDRDLGLRVHPDVQPARGHRRRAKDAPRAQAAIDEGRADRARRPQRERDYIEAVAAYYEDCADRPRARAPARRAPRPTKSSPRATRRTTRRRSSTRCISPARSRSPTRPTRPTSRRRPSSRSSSRSIPIIPGVAHYLIHSYDAPPIAAKGVPAARRYAGIAPAAPHALHMPSHIFTRVGRWKESAETNARPPAARNPGRERRVRATRACTRWTT